MWELDINSKDWQWDNVKLLAKHTLLFTLKEMDRTKRAIDKLKANGMPYNEELSKLNWIKKCLREGVICDILNINPEYAIKLGMHYHEYKYRSKRNDESRNNQGDSEA